METLISLLDKIHSDAPYGVLVCRCDGQIIYSNEQLKKILNTDVEIIGKNFCKELSRLVYRENEENPLTEGDLTEFLKELFVVGSRGNEAKLIFPKELLRKKTSSPIFIEHRSHTFNYQGDTYAMIIVMDISEKKRSVHAQNMAKRIDSHDIRAQLNTIIGFSQIIQSQENDSMEEIVKFASYINKAANNILQISENQSLIAKIQTGQYEPEKINCDFLDFLRKEIILSMGSFTSRGLEIKANYPGDSRLLYNLSLDIKAIKPMLINLVKNALEATEQISEKTVTISAEVTGKNLSIIIHNPGQIPIEIQPYFMTEGATFGKLDGTGLGAFSAKLIAEANNGKITWETSAEAGTTIGISLPI